MTAADDLEATLPFAIDATPMSGVFSVRRPTASFDAGSADDATLLRSGILVPRPPATASPAMLAAWKTIVNQLADPTSAVAPELVTQAGRVHRMAGAPRPAAPPTNASYSPNWAGCAPGIAGEWSSVSGTWTVPTVGQAVEAAGAGGAWFVSTWVGIDGNGTNDVLQTGVDQSTSGSPSASAWYEWYVENPQNVSSQFPYVYQTNITSLAVSPGNVVWGSAQYLKNPAGKYVAGYLVFANTSTGKNFSCVLLPPTGANFSGNSIEWIVEAPSFNNQVSTVGTFNPVVFSSCSGAGTSSQNTAVTGAPNASGVLYMLSSGEELLARTTIGAETVTVEFCGAQKVPGVGTSVGPALAVYGAKLYAAWKGAGTDQGIYFSSFDGSSWAVQQKIAGVGTSVGPTLAAFDGKLYAAWKGAGTDQGIYFSSFNGSSWAAQQKIAGVGTSVGPGLAALGNKLYAAWKGAGTDQGIYFSSFDGSSWAAQQKVAGVGTSVGPGLAAFDGKLYAAWKGAGGDQGIYFSSFDGSSWAAQQKVPGVGTSDAPSLAVSGGKLHASWKGAGSDEHIYWTSFDGSWGTVDWLSGKPVAQEALGVSTSDVPALGALGAALYCVWKGTGSDQGIYVAQIDDVG